MGRLERLALLWILALCGLACRDAGGLHGQGGAGPTGAGGIAGTSGAPVNGGSHGAGMGGAASGGRGGSPSQVVQITKDLTSRGKLDLLFMIDDSSSMAPLQAKMQVQLPSFIDALSDPASGQVPDLHLAVVSSSYGAGAWANVNQCHSRLADPNTLGDDGGRFLQGAVGAQPSPCTMLHAGTKFLANMDGPAMAPNYDGTLADAFKCIALLGDKGCGFESQFESVYWALAKALEADDPDNAGFLRPDAILAIVMLTNEDDCSVRNDSVLMAPVNSVADPSGLGALQSYRCNEFGHLCDGMPPPHDPPPGSGVSLRNCVSAENNGKTDDQLKDPNGDGDPTHGHLWPTVAEFSTYVKMFKSNVDDVLVAAIAGPPVDARGDSLYRVISQANPAAMNEIDPIVDHSCVQQTSAGADPEYADPAVRIKQWVDTFGSNGIFYPICANDFRTAMVTIATRVQGKLHAFCVSTSVALDPSDPTKHACQLTQQTTDASGKQTVRTLPECASGTGNAPCFILTSNAFQCGDPSSKTLVRVCETEACTAPGLSGVVTLTCATDQ